MGRAPCCDRANVKRGPWSPDEDAILRTFLHTHGTAGNWIALPKKAGLRRCGKSCRLRWLNYLRPNIKHGGFTEDEDNIICTLYSQIGSRWATIASQLSGRTDNDVKNYWNTKLKKKLMSGKVVVPSTQFPNSDFPASTNQNSLPSLQYPILTNDAASSKFNNINQNSMDFGLIQQMYNNPQEVMDVNVSEIGASSRNVNNNNVVSLSQEGSSISDSSSIALDYNKCLSMLEHASEESKKEVLMEFGSELFPYDFVNGLNCHERVGEIGTGCCYPDLVDFSYIDIKLEY